MRELVSLMIKIFKLSKVKEGEKVLILTDDSFRLGLGGPLATPSPDHIEAYWCAAQALGANPTLMEMPWNWRTQGEKAFANVLEAMKASDFMVYAGGLNIYTYMSNEALKAGARALTGTSPEECIFRQFPTKELRDLVWAGAELMEAAEEIRFTSEAGTDLRCYKKGRKGHGQFGMADVPGRWDNLTGGLVACAPIEDAVDGKVVIRPGDALQSIMVLVANPITLTVKDGSITKIEGGSHAKLLESWFAKWKDDRSYKPAHVGWGNHPGADWAAMAPMDFENHYANATISWGINIFDAPAKHCGLGGKNDGPSHMDICQRNVSTYLDGELVVDGKKEEIVHPKLKDFAKKAKATYGKA